MANSTKRRIFIITGMSGAGKSQALKIFGDFGFYCVDNLPIALFQNFIDYLRKSGGRQDIALGVDVREGDRLKELPKMLKSMTADDFIVKVLFLDAAEDCLIRRFSETKHRHPIHKKLSAAISHERKTLSPIRSLADKVIDTSNLKLGELKEKLSALLGYTREGEMQISVASFGFKNGILKDCDIVMDVRFLPNPYYIADLKEKTGLEKEVFDYVFSSDETYEFVDKLKSYLDFAVPLYLKEGKAELVVGVGCTGGKHRSVAIAKYLSDHFNDLGYKSSVYHRDIKKIVM